MRYINETEREDIENKTSARNLNETCISDGLFDLEMKPQSV